MCLPFIFILENPSKENLFLTAILSASAPRAIKDALTDLGYDTLSLPPHPTLPRPVSSHPDMLLFFSSDAIFCTESYQRIAKEELSLISSRASRPIRTVKREFGDRYPCDVLLNAAPIGDTLFCLPFATAEELLQSARTVVPVRQGYTKCSVIPVGNRALICADRSIEKAAQAHGFDVLLISNDNIRLDGYDTGFPGGCASFAPYESTDTILFCGALSHLRDGDAMQSFCLEHGHRLLSLGNFSPTDIGTVFLI